MRSKIRRLTMAFLMAVATVLALSVGLVAQASPQRAAAPNFPVQRLNTSLVRAGAVFPGTAYDRNTRGMPYFNGNASIMYIPTSFGGSVQVGMHISANHLQPFAWYRIYIDQNGVNSRQVGTANNWVTQNSYTFQANRFGNAEKRISLQAAPGSHVWAVFINKVSLGATMLISERNFSFSVPAHMQNARVLGGAYINSVTTSPAFRNVRGTVSALPMNDASRTVQVTVRAYNLRPYGMYQPYIDTTGRFDGPNHFIAVGGMRQANGSGYAQWTFNYTFGNPYQPFDVFVNYVHNGSYSVLVSSNVLLNNAHTR